MASRMKMNAPFPLTAAPAIAADPIVLSVTESVVTASIGVESIGAGFLEVLGSVAGLAGMKDVEIILYTSCIIAI